MGLKFPMKEHFYFYASARSRTTDTQWRHKSKKPENLGRCGRQNMPQPYLKIWEWEWIFGCAVKAISSPSICSLCARCIFNFLKVNVFLVGPLKLPKLTSWMSHAKHFPADLLNSNKISSLSEAHCPRVNFYFISEKKCQILAWDDTLHMSESNWESLLVYKAD